MVGITQTAEQPQKLDAAGEVAGLVLSNLNYIILIILHAL